MQELLIYFLKSSGLIAAFYFAYHFLLRKETFFTSNRWFLLTGLLTSALLPLFFIKKTVIVEAPKAVATSLSNLVSDKVSNTISTANVIEQSSQIDWFQIALYTYGTIAILLLLKVIFNLISLFKVVLKKPVTKVEKYQLIDVNENLSPFSFFNYIVYNSSFYSESELQSILLHEKIHSSQKHSLDVLLSNLFSAIFWFNPIMYLYKKAVIQNLEYIADSEAIAQIDDKKSYQMALLKVVSHQNCLPITNHFYQSLIKKRIVMLNKNQSNKKKSWKYAVILPALIAFVILFQVKVIAQEKLITLPDGSQITSTTKDVVEMNWNKNSPNEEFENDAKAAKKSGLDFNFSDIKRNKKNEITNITISFKDKLGNNYTKVFSKKDGIDPIYFRRSIDQNGKGEIGFYNKNKTIGSITEVSTDNLNNDNNLDEYTEVVAIAEEVSETTMTDFPTPPTPPSPPSAPAINFEVAKFPNMPNPPTPPSGSPLNNEKAWKKYEKKMEEYDKKIQAIEPEIKAFEEKMSKYDEQMKPFEKEMEAFEKKMEVFEKQMQVFEIQVEAYNKKMQNHK